MPGTMSEADLVMDLKASLKDAALPFVAANDEDFKRHLRAAADDFVRVRPRTVFASLTAVADVSDYDAPLDFGELQYSTWGQKRLQPWEAGYSGRLPHLTSAEVSGVRKLILDPAPSQANINDAGAVVPYRYSARHVISSDAAQTTIPNVQRGLLILRAQAEALRELAFRNIQKPTQVIDGFSSGTRNGTPAALYQELLREWKAVLQ